MKQTIHFKLWPDMIRQMPQNYLLCRREKGHWICDPDAAIDLKIAAKCFKLIHTNHSLKFGNGLDLCDCLTR